LVIKQKLPSFYVLNPTGKNFESTYHKAFEPKNNLSTYPWSGNVKKCVKEIHQFVHADYFANPEDFANFKRFCQLQTFLLWK
jgi:hypothetical protein